MAASLINHLGFCALWLTVLFMLPLMSHCADPDPLQDFCVAVLDNSSSSIPGVNGFPCKPASEVTSDDFFFDGFTQEGDTNNVFGSALTPGNVLTFPALNTQGIAMNRVDIGPGGMNPPHSHPRASETGVVIQGKVLVGFVTAAGNVFYSKVLRKGEMFVIPRGLVHFQMNVGKNKALLFTAFNSQLPGAVVLPLTLFASKPPIPVEVLTKAFQVDADVVHGIKAKFGAN
ncbi:PREDICTED: germin-like protein subfamily T member 1 [Ipomoea nil]|uniref:germin-like protein subfamily T member 1 n=1 Tax=Ipomoea nil TaxID=35883 RepID=UPI000901B0D5|nr:PREDICTED: germin-like protein subfamily T member 1 [Ipomoea nil]